MNQQTAVQPAVNEHDDDEGTVVASNLPITADVAAQVDIAHRYPRSLARFRANVVQVATITQEVAEECSYALPHGDKPIVGPSARFAEILASCYKNIRVVSRIVEDTGTFIVAEGAAWDVEANYGKAVQIRRKITDKNGRRYSDDMVGVTANAAASIASRNAVCQVIPKAYWHDLWQKVRQVAVGGEQTIAQRRDRAIQKLGQQGVLPAMILAKLGREGVEEITLDDLEVLFGAFNAIKEGDSTVEELFAMPTAEAKAAPASGSDAMKAALGKKGKPKHAGEYKGPTYAVIADQITKAKTPEQIELARDLVRQFPDEGQRAELEAMLPKAEA